MHQVQSLSSLNEDEAQLFSKRQSCSRSILPSSSVPTLPPMPSKHPRFVGLPKSTEIPSPGKKDVKHFYRCKTHQKLIELKQRPNSEQKPTIGKSKVSRGGILSHLEKYDESKHQLVGKPTDYLKERRKRKGKKPALSKSACKDQTLSIDELNSLVAKAHAALETNPN